MGIAGDTSIEVEQFDIPSKALVDPRETDSPAFGSPDRASYAGQKVDALMRPLAAFAPTRPKTALAERIIAYENTVGENRDGTLVKWLRYQEHLALRSLHPRERRKGKDTA